MAHLTGVYPEVQAGLRQKAEMLLGFRYCPLWRTVGIVVTPGQLSLTHLSSP